MGKSAGKRGWSVTYAAHNEALRKAERRFQAERDRRLTELRQADQRALEIKARGDEEARRIKEQGDEKALVLAREIQTYKDEVHNGILSQLKDERSTYATKTEIKPLLEYVAAQQGRGEGMDRAGTVQSEAQATRSRSSNLVLMIVSVVIAGAGLLIGAAGIFLAFWKR